MASARPSHVGARLDEEGTAGRAEIDERGRGLRVEVPVEQCDDGLEIEQDDARSARRAEQEAKLRAVTVAKIMVGSIELRGRLPGSTRLATGRPSSSTGMKEKSVS